MSRKCAESAEPDLEVRARDWQASSPSPEDASPYRLSKELPTAAMGTRGPEAYQTGHTAPVPIDGDLEFALRNAGSAAELRQIMAHARDQGLTFDVPLTRR